MRLVGTWEQPPSKCIWVHRGGGLDLKSVATAAEVEDSQPPSCVALFGEADGNNLPPQKRTFDKSLGGITMFWFISPWEAARRSMQAQRQLMALPWMFMASGRRYQGLSDGEHASTEAPPIPVRSMATAGTVAVPARRAVETIKASVGARGQDKKPKRKNKSRRK